MPSLNIPPREQHLIDLYAKDFILMFEFEGLLKSVRFEEESFNFNLALSRMSLRFADMVRTDPLFPRLKGIYSKTIIANAWDWSKASETLHRLAAEGIGLTPVDNAALRLASLEGIPRKMGTAEVVVRREDLSKARKIAGNDDAVRFRGNLFRVHTLKDGPQDGLVAFDDRAGGCTQIPSTELQFLMLCSNNALSLAGNIFDDRCLQWVMDAIDIVRKHPEISWKEVSRLASAHRQTATLQYAMNILKQTVPAIFSGMVLPLEEVSEAEREAISRQALYLEADRRCRDNAGKTGPAALCRRLLLRLVCNIRGIARFFPRKGMAGILLLAPGYHFRKYLHRTGAPLLD